tara:strand:- start:9376 stop:9633 length:258 start_codon:yes stop_codon:yes gene_type:complete
VVDQVNHPPHYQSEDGIECIDAIRASMSSTEFTGYLKGNAMKYLWRYTYKGHPYQDLDKSSWYLELLKEVVAEETGRTATKGSQS